MKRPTPNAPQPPAEDRLAQFAADLLALVEIVEKLPERIARLEIPSSAGTPEDRLAALLALWRKLGLGTGCDAAKMRADQCAAALRNRETAVRIALTALFTRIGHEISRILAVDGAAEQVGILRKEHFERTRSIGRTALALLSALPSDHWAHHVMEPEETFFLDGDKPALVLGDKNDPWYSLTDVRRLTKEFAENQQRERAQARRREQADQTNTES